MPNQHRTKYIGWHPSDPTLQPWVDGEAERRGVTRRELLDEALSEYRARQESGTQPSSTEEHQ